MNTKVRTAVQGMKAVSKHDKGMQKENESLDNKRMLAIEKAPRRCHQSSREKKIALQQDIDKLKRKLRHEENVHKALERAFTRPLGALPRLPPYLSSRTLELLAEVAVLEEEVVRLEEQVVNFRQGLYHEAIYISSSKKTKENGQDTGLDKPLASIRWFTDTTQNLPTACRANSGKKTMKRLNSSVAFPEDHKGKENQLNSVFARYDNKCTMTKVTKTQVATLELKQTEEQEECWMSDQVEPEMSAHCASNEDALEDSNVVNKLSEDILMCLMNIFLRMNSMMGRDEELETSPSVSGSSECSDETESCDPYGICLEFGKRDIGPYKHFRSVEVKVTCSDLLTSSTFLIRRLKLLLRKLASVNLSGLTHQQKLAFWINVYNSCMMNAYLEQGIPSTPEMIVALMPKAMINVCGHLLSAMTIEHFILRLPYQSKNIISRGPKYDEITMRGVFGLEWPEPLVTFALSCGSWSSPAVRVYRAQQVENELRIAKRNYLQAAVGIASPDKLAIPKLLDWYLLDFAKDVDSLVDWVCMQLPSELRTEAVKCLELNRGSAIPQSIQILPYEFRFRYLLAP